MDMHEAKEMMAAPALGARRFFRWWLSELGALVPSNWRARAYTDSQILIVQADETSLRVSTENKGGQHLIVAASAGSESETVRAAIRIAAQDVGAQIGDSQQVFLRLPHQFVLSRELELPIAEESQLRQMLSLQLDNLTPFKEAEIYWDCAILEKHRKRGRMRVHLVVVQRVDVDPILKRISLCGLELSGIEVAREGTDAPAGVNLLPHSQRVVPDRQDVSRRNLLYANAFLLIAVLVTPLAGVTWQGANLRSDQQEMVAEVEAVVALRRRLEALSDRDASLIAIRGQRATALAVLNELSLLLPEDTWLRSLHISGNSVRLQGYSANATGLLAPIEQSDLFESASFQSAVTRTGPDGSQQFQLSATLASTRAHNAY